MKKENLEIRNVTGISIRSDEPESISRTVTGYAIRFNSPSENIGFIEEIEAGAITQEQIDSSDIFCFYNHDMDKVLARSINGEGTLKLTVDEEGLKYEFEAPHTVIGDELLEHITRGELFGTSFGFALDSEDCDTWEKKEDGMWYRTIHKIPYLFEVSPVFQPAYTDTSCSKRGTDKINEMEGILQTLDNEMKSIEDGLKDFNIKCSE